MRASRSQATHDITLEYVCTAERPRNSQSPASGWSCSAPRRFAGMLEPRERGRVAGDVEAPVEEELHRREHDAAVDVVLRLPPGIVADPHRAHAAITRQMPSLRSRAARARNGCRRPARARRRADTARLKM